MERQTGSTRLTGSPGGQGGVGSGGGDDDLLRAVKEAAAAEYDILGEMGRGERGSVVYLSRERASQKLVALTKERGADDPIIRDRVAQEWIELQALKLTNYRSLTTLMQTGIPGPEGSVSKLHWSEQNQRLTKLAMEILEGEDDGYWRHQQLRSRGNTIEAGTSEIQRNIIAERVLGLPRSR